MTVSVIVTTYNWPEALNLTLQSLLHQSRLPNEVIVADDGSKEPTARTVNEFAEQAPFPVIHSWQEDLGFRAAMSRNRAAAISSSEYLIFIDGDMLLHKHFIVDHLRYAEEKYFLQGGRALLDREITLKTLKNENMDFTPFTPGLSNRLNSCYCPSLSRLFVRSNHSMRGIRTCNFSLFNSP